jgi:hypothetical protein
VKILLIVLLSAISVNIIAQKKWHSTLAAYFAIDAAGTYFGPAISLGLDKNIKNTKVGASVHYFAANLKSKIYKDTGILRMLTGNVYAEKYLFKQRLKKMYGGIGVGYQYRYEDYKGFFIISGEERFTWTLCYKLGYTLSNKSSTNPLLHLELFGTGPYKENYVNGNYTELLTQLSLGCKITF